MTDISVFCHEFGHMLGLPDLYARSRKLPGMEGVGQLVRHVASRTPPAGRNTSQRVVQAGQLGWIKPTMPVDPTEETEARSSRRSRTTRPSASRFRCKPDGSEYLLLENRQQKGFDAKLPASGLLIWRVLPANPNQKVFLEEAHGIEDASGPRSHLGAVPFPSPANSSFTPYTTPSSRPQTGGGLEAWITDIRRLPDGRVTLAIGYEYQ